MRQTRSRMLSVAMAMALMLVGCQATTSPSPSGPQTSAGPSSPSPAASPTAGSDAERRGTLIIGFEGGQIASPDIGNPFSPARWPMISAGLHQAVFESLFYL
ncbi:MAG: hypothetical protein C4307_00055, partial [Chloroflexota bacterium]